MERALRLVAQTGEGHYLAELYRLQGELLRQAAAAEQARSLQLRPATSLACLLGEQGDKERVVPLLAPICAWFDGQPATADIGAVRTLLRRLTSQR